MLLHLDPDSIVALDSGNIVAYPGNVALNPCDVVT